MQSHNERFTDKIEAAQRELKLLEDFEKRNVRYVRKVVLRTGRGYLQLEGESVMDAFDKAEELNADGGFMFYDKQTGKCEKRMIQNIEYKLEENIEKDQLEIRIILEP